MCDITCPDASSGFWSFRAGSRNNEREKKNCANCNRSFFCPVTVTVGRSSHGRPAEGDARTVMEPLQDCGFGVGRGGERRAVSDSISSHLQGEFQTVCVCVCIRHGPLASTLSSSPRAGSCRLTFTKQWPKQCETRRPGCLVRILRSPGVMSPEVRINGGPHRPTFKWHLDRQIRRGGSLLSGLLWKDPPSLRGGSKRHAV